MKSKTLKIWLMIWGLMLLGSSCEYKSVDVDLTANAWKVEKIRPAGQFTYEAADSVYILQFSGFNTYILSLDVNTCGGQYTIPQAGRIVFQNAACTEICCDTDFAMDLSELLPEVSSYFVRNNRLHLEGEGEIILQSHGD